MKYKDFEKIKKAENKAKNILGEVKEEFNEFAEETSDFIEKLTFEAKFKLLKMKAFGEVFSKLYKSEDKNIFIVKDSDFDFTKVASIETPIGEKLPIDKLITLSSIIVDSKKIVKDAIVDTDYDLFWKFFMDEDTDIERRSILLDVTMQDDTKLKCNCLKFFMEQDD